MRFLTTLGSALSTYGGLSYLVSLPFCALWVVSIQLDFSYEGCTIYVHYYLSLFNGRIHSNIHLLIHVIQSLFFSLVFLCMLMRILSRNIYFLSLFLAYFLIALELLFLHGIKVQGCSIYTEFRSTSSLLSLSEDELV